MAVEFNTTTERSWLRDAAERVGVTFIEAFAASLVASHVIDMPALQQAWNMAAVAAIASGAALAKAILARYTGTDPESASLVD